MLKFIKNLFRKKNNQIHSSEINISEEHIVLDDTKNNKLEDETLISEAIEKNKWVIFYFHDLKEVDAKTLREILTYIASKEEQLEVITYHNMYKTVYGLEKR